MTQLRPRDGTGRDATIEAEPVREGVLLFDADGAVVAMSADERAMITPPIRTLAELEARYRQSDGFALSLGSRGRRVGVPAAGGRRVLLVSEPLVPLNVTSAALSVALIPFGTEDDPQTVQRALGSVLAHELRTPMTTIYAGAQLVSGSAASESVRGEAARQIAVEAEHLNRIVEDLLVMVRWSLDAPPELEPVLIRPIVDAVVARRAAVSRGTRIDVRADADLPAVIANEAAVAHIARNLIEVAASNTPAGGLVTVDLVPALDHVDLRVSDGGPVRAEAELDGAFDLFSPGVRRGDASGANLSLVVTRRLAERIGARIRAVPIAPGGRIDVSFPVATG